MSDGVNVRPSPAGTSDGINVRPPRSVREDYRITYDLDAESIGAATIVPCTNDELAGTPFKILYRPDIWPLHSESVNPSAAQTPSTETKGTSQATVPGLPVWKLGQPSGIKLSRGQITKASGTDTDYGSDAICLLATLAQTPPAGLLDKMLGGALSSDEQTPWSIELTSEMLAKQLKDIPEEVLRGVSDWAQTSRDAAMQVLWERPGTYTISWGSNGQQPSQIATLSALKEGMYNAIKGVSLENQKPASTDSENQNSSDGLALRTFKQATECTVNQTAEGTTVTMVTQPE